MSKKVNTTVKIKCNDVDTANLLFSLLEGHAPQHKNDMNGLFARHGKGIVDTTFIDFNREKLTFSVTTKPTDKGEVFVLTDGEVNIVSYTDLSHGEVYGMIDQGTKIYSFVEDGYDKHWATVASMTSLKEALEHIPTDPQVIAFLENLQRQKDAALEGDEVEVISETAPQEAQMEVVTDDVKEETSQD